VVLLLVWKSVTNDFYVQKSSQPHIHLTCCGLNG